MVYGLWCNTSEALGFSMMLHIIESSLIAITITNKTNTEYSSFYYDINYSDEVYFAIIVEIYVYIRSILLYIIQFAHFIFQMDSTTYDQLCDYLLRQKYPGQLGNCKNLKRNLRRKALSFRVDEKNVLNQVSLQQLSIPYIPH